MSDSTPKQIATANGLVHCDQRAGFARAAANGNTFAVKPIRAAIDELAAEMSEMLNANHQAKAALPILSGAELAEAVFDLSYGPQDRPNPEILFQGWGIGLDGLVSRLPAVAGLHQAIGDLQVQEVPMICLGLVSLGSLVT